MAKIGVAAVLGGKNSLQKLQRQSDRASNDAPVRGADSQQAPLGIRISSQTYLATIQNISQTASNINMSSETLGQLDSLVNGLVDLSEAAADPALTEQERQTINEDFANLVLEYENLVAEAAPEELAFLASGGLEDALEDAGLEEQTAISVADLLNEFVEVSPEQAVRKGAPEEPLHETTATILKSAEITITDEKGLRSLREQVETGIQTLKHASRNVQFAIDVAKVSQDQPTVSAQESEELAHSLEAKIKKFPAAALSQADNLDASSVTALLTAP